VGLIADSHVGEFLDALPAGVMDALDGCDLLLHAGDLSVPSVLDDLGALAPTFAVRGDHDRLDDLALPETLVATVAGRRIGLVHGTLGPITDAAVVSAHVVAGRRLAYDGDLHARLLRRVGPVDCLVYGHWHEPRSAMVDATLCVSPGAVCPRGTLAGGRAPRPGLAGMSDRGVRRFRRQLGAVAMQPTVAVLEVGTAGIRPRWITIPDAPDYRPLGRAD